MARDLSTRAPSVRLVALAAGLALLGDSLLYVVLPLEGERLALDASQVGTLLAINRLVRIVLNEPAGALLRRIGARAALVLALALAALTTAGYAWSTHRAFAWFVVARVVWGLAWSLVRHGANAAVLANPPEKRGELQGTFRGLSRIGSLATVLLGAKLVEQVGFAKGYELLGLFTLPGIALAWLAWKGGVAAPSPTLPRSAGEGDARGGSRAFWVVSLVAVLVNAVGASLLVATASLRVKGLVGPAGAIVALGVTLPLLTLSGIAGSGRWIAEIVAAPFAGRIADRHGRAVVLASGGASAAAALLLCAVVSSPLAFIAAALVAFIALAIVQTGLDALATDLAAEGSAAEGSSGGHAVAMTRLGRYATAVDAASAVGPYVGPLLPGTLGLEAAFVAGGAVSLAVALAARRLARRSATADRVASG